MKLPEEPDIPAQINIVPMIDVIFAILVSLVGGVGFRPPN